MGRFSQSKDSLSLKSDLSKSLRHCASTVEQYAKIFLTTVGN